MKYVYLSAFIICLLTCTTSNPGVGSVVLEHQQQINQLEARNADLTNRIDKYTSAVTASEQRLGDLARRAGDAATTVDEVIRLFTEYQREVERLLQSSSELTNKVESNN